ncbi:MAG: tRNA (adenosine(37)-N6)-threonylcarbamoyltransferase complex ATPase subunit type 1 TsaE [bacterium]|nr:tRNA (adenosine(37)-N6)-threonylcarbamoyltransferase complex ATPase subunit type 1 TsaE [bacterium]
MEKQIQTFAELEIEAKRFITELVPKAGGATLITLSGELGAGKTAFTKAVAHALGVEEIVTSPTFVLEKIYPIRKLEDSRSNGASLLFSRLVHIDVYRLEKGADLAPLGFDELMKDSSNLILLEWPEKVIDVLPKPSMNISIVANTDDSRVITYG